MPTAQKKPNPTNQFLKGMTLQDYLRGMDLNEEKLLPTADSGLHGDAYLDGRDGDDDEEQCLYVTSGIGRQTRRGIMGEIQEECYEESLEQFKESVNIVSTHLKHVGKRDKAESVNLKDQKKTYRIRNGKSVSPYQSTLKPEIQKTMSPYKTYLKNFYSSQQMKNTQDAQNRENRKMAMVRTLYGKQFELRRSTKNLQIQPIPPNISPSPPIFPSFPKKSHLRCQSQLSKYNTPPPPPPPPHHHRQIEKMIDLKLCCREDDADKIQLRVELMKDRLQAKRKGTGSRNFKRD